MELSRRRKREQPQGLKTEVSRTEGDISRIAYVIAKIGGVVLKMLYPAEKKDKLT